MVLVQSRLVINLFLIFGIGCSSGRSPIQVAVKASSSNTQAAIFHSLQLDGCQGDSGCEARVMLLLRRRYQFRAPWVAKFYNEQLSKIDIFSNKKVFVDVDAWNLDDTPEHRSRLDSVSSSRIAFQGSIRAGRLFYVSIPVRGELNLVTMREVNGSISGVVESCSASLNFGDQAVTLTVVPEYGGILSLDPAGKGELDVILERSSIESIVSPAWDFIFPSTARLLLPVTQMENGDLKFTTDRYVGAVSLFPSVAADELHGSLTLP